MQTLILVRHGESEGNNKGILTGQMDVSLTPAGVLQAERAGQAIYELGINLDEVYSSSLKRARETVSLIMNQLSRSSQEATGIKALDERDFGEYTGLSKKVLIKKLGEVEYKKIIKGWDIPAPSGESLRDVQNRVLPFFMNTIIADLSAKKNVLISSHHQTLRALIKHIEGVTDSEIQFLSVENAKPLIYEYIPVDRSFTRKPFAII